MYAGEETLYRTTIARNPNCWLFHNNLGNLLVGQGQSLAAQGQTDKAAARYREAIEHFHDALKANPEYVLAHIDLGNVLARLGRTEEAIAQYNTALKIDPNSADAHFNFAVTLKKQGRIKEAIVEYEKAVKLNPNDLGALSDLAWLRATSPDAALRNGKEAVELAERALHLSNGPEPPIVVLNTLAAAYAEAGRFPEAVQTARIVLNLATFQKNAALAESVKARMRLYMARTPYREQPSASLPAPQP